MAFDDFNRANESPLASPWAKVATSGLDDTLRLVSNAVTTTTATTARRLYAYTGSARSADQYAQALQVTAPTDGNWGVAARIQSNHSYYGVSGASSVNGQIYKYVADVYTELASGVFDVDIANGDYIGIEVVGSRIRALKNGVIEHEVTDTSITSAGLGCGIAWWEAGGSVDNFSGGDVATGYQRIFGPAHLGTSAVTLYAVPFGKRTRLRHIYANNPSGSPVDFTFSIGDDAAALRLYDSFNVPAGGSLEWAYDHALAAGEKIQAYAGTSSALVLTVDAYVQPQ